MLFHARPRAQLLALHCAMSFCCGPSRHHRGALSQWHGQCGPAALHLAWGGHALRLPLIYMQVTCSLHEHCWRVAVSLLLHCL